MREESFDFRHAHGFRVALAVKEDELPDPADVRFFGTFGVVEEADFLPDAIEEPGLGNGRELRLLRIRGRHRPPIVCDRVPAIASAELYELAATQSTHDDNSRVATRAMAMARGREWGGRLNPGLRGGVVGRLTCSERAAIGSAFGGVDV